jgi:starvation-inducible DNA-binding protein
LKWLALRHRRHISQVQFQESDSHGKATEGHIDTGIDEKDRAAIAEGLSRLLADTDTLYLTTHNFHWNVTGPMFNTLHDMFMVQYAELWNSVDLIAERIRSLGHKAPRSYAQFSELTSSDEPTAWMLRSLLQN